MKRIEKTSIAFVLASVVGMTGITGVISAQQSGNSGSIQNGNSNAMRGNRNGGSEMNSNMSMNSNMGMNSNMSMNSNTSMNSMNSNMNPNSMNSNMSMGMGSDMLTIGNMSKQEFDRINAQGAAAVAAITPNSTPLSKGDSKLMMEVAMGGMRQLEVSRVAVQKATDAEARILAQSEVEEQTALSAKLKEIATAKNVTLPEAPDAKTQALITKMQNLSGADFDRTYVNESGVKGHVKLDSTMGKVESKATDDSLKSLAAAARPLVRTHLQVSRDVLAKMSGKSNGSNSSNSNSNRSSNSNSNSNR